MGRQGGAVAAQQQAIGNYDNGDYETAELNGQGDATTERFLHSIY
jgi:hypothetical protein